MSDKYDDDKKEIDRIGAEIERLKRSEFICEKCGLRKDSLVGVKGDF